MPTANVSAICQNILFLRQVEVDATLLRLVSVMKTRDSSPDRRLWRYEITDRGDEQFVGGLDQKVFERERFGQE